MSAPTKPTWCGAVPPATSRRARELVTTHERMVYQLAFHLLGNRDEALDLSQEVFLRVFRTIGAFRGQSSLRTWIYRIVVNQARNRQRWWRRRRQSDQVSLDQHIADPRRAARSPATSPRPTALLARKEAGGAPVAGARPPAVRPAHRDRAARVRRPQLRGNRVLARHRRRHREVAADPRPAGAARRPRRGAGHDARAVRRRPRAPRGVPRRRAAARDAPGGARASRRMRRLRLRSRRAARACAQRSAMSPARPRARRRPTGWAGSVLEQVQVERAAVVAHLAARTCSTTCTWCGRPSARRRPCSSACWPRPA